MRVAVIDVGSNSVRLLIASAKPGRPVRELDRDRVYLRLGDDAYRLGRIGDAKIHELGATAARFAQRARAAGVEQLETIVTAPGRQSANADVLVQVLADATQASVTVLTAEEEGRLAWEGAVASYDALAGLIGVVDLGGGSCEVAVGSVATGPDWIRSCDAGALRVTRSFLSNARPGAKELRRGRGGVRELLADMNPAHPDTALAVGGTARAVARVVGPRFGARKLDALANRIVDDGLEGVIRGHDVTPARAETLLGGTLVLAEIARRLDAKLEVGRGGLREGAALALARSRSAAA